MLTNPKVLVAIPAYNCEGQISRVLDEISPQLEARVSEIAVFENRSTDDTLGRALDYLETKRLSKLHQQLLMQTSNPE